MRHQSYKRGINKAVNKKTNGEKTRIKASKIPMTCKADRMLYL